MVIKKALAAPGTLLRFEGFPGNEPWADALDYARLEILSSLSLIQSHRRQIAELLVNNPPAWSCGVCLTGPQGENSQENQAADIIQMLTEHMLEHVREIEKIKASAAPD